MLTTWLTSAFSYIVSILLRRDAMHNADYTIAKCLFVYISHSDIVVVKIAKYIVEILLLPGRGKLLSYVRHFI